MSDIRSQLAAIALEIQPNAIVDTPDAFDLGFREIGIDSLESMNFLLAVQEKTGVNIPDDVIDTLNSLGDVERFISGGQAR